MATSVRNVALIIIGFARCHAARIGFMSQRPVLTVDPAFGQP
jgi:hypothetical protein